MVRSIRAVLAASLLLAVSAGATYAAAPTNDDIGTPEVIAAIPYTNAQETTEATSAGSDPDCAGGAATVWYSFTPADTGWYQLDTFGSDYDTTLAVGTPDGGGGIELLACNDDSGDGVQSRLKLLLESGVEYLAAIGSFGGGSGGSLVFNVDVTDEPIQLDLTVTIDSAGRFTRDGLAHVSGTVACNIDAFGYLEVRVTQRVGRFSVVGYGWTEFGCSSAGGTWQVDVAGITGGYAGGNATVELYAEAFAPDAEASDQEYIQRVIRLAR